jgi:hypothetical protein
MNPDWRVGVFSSPVIMIAMNPHLTLRDIGALIGTYRWTAEWRVTMTSVFRMRMRIALRWPRGAGIYKFNPDLIAAVQDKARQALLRPMRGETFECWIGQCASNARKMPIARLCDTRIMPYASCNTCIARHTPRHARYTASPSQFCISLISKRLAISNSDGRNSVISFINWCGMINTLIDGPYFMADMLIPMEEIDQCQTNFISVNHHNDTTWYDSNALQVLVDREVVKRDLCNKWVEYCAIQTAAK